jgi:hypothetical protein
LDYARTIPETREGFPVLLVIFVVVFIAAGR